MSLYKFVIRDFKSPHSHIKRLLLHVCSSSEDKADAVAEDYIENANELAGEARFELGLLITTTEIQEGTYILSNSVIE